MNPEVRRQALLAFAGHAPLLWLAAGVRLSWPVLVVNVLAVAATFSVVIWRFAVGDPRSALAVWVGGHLGWSAVLAGLVVAGRVGGARGADP